MEIAESPPSIGPAIRFIAMPADANPSGDIFGGWIMPMMDMAGANVAYERASGRVATMGLKSSPSISRWRWATWRPVSPR